MAPTMESPFDPPRYNDDGPLQCCNIKKGDQLDQEQEKK